MGFSYLDGKSWSEVTREERFFCQHLFCLLKRHGASGFLEHVESKVGIVLPETTWEPAFEACFYRDLWQLKGRSGELFSPKRTFDLCLFSEEAIVVIEAKAQQGFDTEQLSSFEADREQVEQLTGACTYLVGLASSACPETGACSAVFDGPLLRWRDLAALYDDDPVLLRADAIYEPGQGGSWGKNNQGGYMTGEELLAAYERGERFHVGCRGGLYGSRFAEELRSGAWRSRRYETNRGPSRPNTNWFGLEEFAQVVMAESGQAHMDSRVPETEGDEA
jgi:hypothetical protein